MTRIDLCMMSAVQMADAIRRRQVSPVELTQAVLYAIDEQDPVLNAFVTVDGDLALLQARQAEAAVLAGKQLGPLHGVPVSIKDSFAVRGLRTTFGSKIFAGAVADEDAPLVERLRRAGAVILGKTTMPEFAWKAVTDSPLSGITRNPWNPAYSPGGSSGGAAAHVAAGLGALAIGTDGGGSIRIPAAFTGIYGLKPTFGRVPAYPSSAFDALSHPGPLTRTVADAALLLSVIAGPHCADRLSLEAQPADYTGRLAEGVKGLRIAWSPNFGFARVDPQVATAASEAAHVFTELGAHVEEVIPEFGDSTELYRVFLQVGAAASIAEYLPQREAELDPGLVNVARAGMALSALDFARAQRERHRFYDRVRRFFAHYDLLLSPTVPILPLPAGHNAPDPHSLGEDWISWSPFTFPFNLTQMPAASVPASCSHDSLPIGLQIVGRRLADLTVLQASAAFEEARPWTHRWPPVAQQDRRIPAERVRDSF
jgi:aspartyl-tRNA(Asn)/glutamyl-tRNA(Gln) amidotransferase subunit A